MFVLVLVCVKVEIHIKSKNVTRSIAWSGRATVPIVLAAVGKSIKGVAKKLMTMEDI